MQICPWVLQTLLAQHVCPVPPQEMQVPPEHSRLAEEQVLPQHAWFVPPQGWQLPAEHTVLLAVQAFPLQQGWLEPPHATHVDAEQTAPPLHVVPQHGC